MRQGALVTALATASCGALFPDAGTGTSTSTPIFEGPDSKRSEAPAPEPVLELNPSVRSRLTLETRPSLEGLATKLGLRGSPLVIPCLRGSETSCERRALDRTWSALDALLSGPTGNFRALQLGDSHIAADYITKTIREILQAQFGDAGRGFTHVDQREGYGGRRIAQRGGWTRLRMVDTGQAGQRLGFAGISAMSTRAGVSLDFVIASEDQVTIYADAGVHRPELRVELDNERLGTLSTATTSLTTIDKTFKLPRLQANRPAPRRILHVFSNGAGARVHGLGFTKDRPGLLWDSVGPVGADAAAYLSLDPASFQEHLGLLEPALWVLMLGGNDALRVRQKRATMALIEQEIEALADRLKAAAPAADCLVWGPMDAGEERGGKVVSKALVGETRDLLQRLAAKKGCAFWDLYAVMGGPGSIAHWAKENIINQDLIHPRAKAGELIGYLFAKAFLEAYLAPIATVTSRD